MNENNNWSEINDDISEIKDKIKNSINEDNLSSDLKDSLKNAVDSAGRTLNELKKYRENSYR